MPQDQEPVLASHLHSSIIAHGSLEASLAFILANKLSSPTLLATNVMQMILKAYKSTPVCARDDAGGAGRGRTSALGSRPLLRNSAAFSSKVMCCRRLSACAPSVQTGDGRAAAGAC